MKEFFDFGEKNKFALFPIPAGQKSPHGIVDSFVHDWSRDPAQWKAWHDEHKCNFGLVAGRSGLIIADVDVAEIGREAAWQHWSEWCGSRGLPVFDPYCESARGGWHIAFALPKHVDVKTLRQVPLIGPIEGISKKSIIDLRVGNGYVVAPGSNFQGRQYTLFPDAAVHPAPDALFAACSRTQRKASAVRAGTADVGQTQKALEWMAEHDCFADYHDWLAAGMALRAHFGDEPGFPLWQITNNGTCSADAEAEKWQTFSSEPSADGVDIGTLRHMANTATCPHKIGMSTASMFAGVAQLAASGGAPGMPPVPTVESPSLVPNMPAQLSADGRASLGAIATAAEKERTEKAKASGEQTTTTENKPALPRYYFETVSDLRSMPPQTWLVDRWIPDRSVGIIYGRFASGKSFIAFDLLLHLAYGMENWHGITLPGIPCCGLLIAREGGTGFQRRVDAFKKHHNITDDTDRMVFMRSPVNFGDPAQFAELKAAIETCGRQFKAVVVDTVGRALPGEDMFDPKSITRFMEHLQQIGEIAQGVSIGIHHENKAGDVMGSIYFDNNSDFMFHVEREGDPAQGPLRRGKITCVKQKDGEDGWARDVSYKFVDTDPNGEGSLVIDSLTGSGAASKATAKLTPKEGLALTALSDVLKAKGQLGGDIGGRSVTLDEWKEGCFSNGSVSRDAARPLRDLHDRQVGLITKGRILVLNDRVRLVGGDLKGEPGNVVPMVPTLPSNAVPMPPGTANLAITRGPA